MFARPAVRTGTVARKESALGFVTADGAGERIFFHKHETSAIAWDALRTGARAAFKIGFSFNGPVACAVEPLD